MGLFGGAKASKTSSRTEGWETRNTKTTQFDEEVLSQLESLLLGEIGEFGQSYDDLADQMLNEVLGGQAIDIDPIMKEAERKSNQQIGQNYQALARQAGSDANSLVQAAQAESIADAQSLLAATRAELEAKNKEDKLSQVSQALGLRSEGLSPILGLGTLLKGARTEEDMRREYMQKGTTTSFSGSVGFKAPS